MTGVRQYHNIEGINVMFTWLILTFATVLRTKRSFPEEDVVAPVGGTLQLSTTTAVCGRAQRINLHPYGVPSY